MVGVGRGQTFMNQAEASGMKLVAICDVWKDRLESVGKKFGVAIYTDFDRFLEHDMDAVVLANYFHEHAPYAVKALNAGFHVMSECAASHTLAEGVALCRAVEKSKKIYMLAENYPYNAANIELGRLYKAGEIGEVLYAEGEYNHPMSPEAKLRISPGKAHWRNALPLGTYYCTHALAPLMTITDTMPVSVNALSVAWPDKDREPRISTADGIAAILCRMDNGAVFRLFGISAPGHSVWYRLHGMRGLMEHVRGTGYWGPGAVRIAHDEWDLKKDEVTERSYHPQFPAWAHKALSAGHGGGDFFTNRYFADAIRTGRQPYLDVYRGVAMSAVGVLAWKSCLENGRPFEMPDFRSETSRRKYENDNWSPLTMTGPERPPVSIRPGRKPSRAAAAYAKKIWRRNGYNGE